MGDRQLSDVWEIHVDIAELLSTQKMWALNQKYVCALYWTWWLGQLHSLMWVTFKLLCSWSGEFLHSTAAGSGRHSTSDVDTSQSDRLEMAGSQGWCHWCRVGGWEDHQYHYLGRGFSMEQVTIFLSKNLQRYEPIKRHVTWYYILLKFSQSPSATDYKECLWFTKIYKQQAWSTEQAAVR